MFARIINHSPFLNRDEGYPVSQTKDYGKMGCEAVERPAPKGGLARVYGCGVSVINFVIIPIAIVCPWSRSVNRPS